MEIKQIVFTEPNVAKLLSVELGEPTDNQVLVKTAFSTISSGTERANLIGDPNVSPTYKAFSIKDSFPRKVGYCSSGIVCKVGKNVTSLKVGDRVIGTWSKHASYNLFNEGDVVKLDDSISLSDAATCFISTFSLAGLRKTQPEAGESILVFGLGILGLFSIKLALASGLYPVIAVDPNKNRREMALNMGADYALDPTEEGFVQKVKEITNGGANVAIEVTGIGKALDQALDCMAKFGRVSLLGCTRNSDFSIDYYRKVHFPGITLVGAHTKARPKFESAPHYFTEIDDLKTVLNLIKGKRFIVSDLVSEIHSPTECEEVFRRLAFDREFPIGVQFDWSKL